MAGKFEVYEDKAGKFRFRLKASNGQIVASGEAYETRAAAKKGCESVQKAAQGAPIEEAS
ncbi:YegP family protein [Actinomycetospora sp. C-140]